jgi:peptidylprolyl isomerase
MKKYVLTFIACAAVSLLRAGDAQSEKKEEKKESPAFEIAQVSEAFGHLIGKNLQNIGMKFDVAQVVKGLQDSLAGKESPMSEMECIQALTAAQEKAFKEQSQDNLKKAEVFLQDNAKTTGVTSLENGKVQFRIDKEGKGSALESHYSPLIRYTGKFMDGTVFSTSKEEEKICLEEVIPGLRSGLVGMKEGEKRSVYIHPDLAYGTSGCLPPNALLTFEVELVQANAPSIEENTELKTEQEEGKKSTSELADSDTHVR